MSKTIGKLNFPFIKLTQYGYSVSDNNIWTLMIIKSLVTISNYAQQVITICILRLTFINHLTSVLPELVIQLSLFSLDIFLQFSLQDYFCLVLALLSQCLFLLIDRVRQYLERLFKCYLYCALSEEWSSHDYIWPFYAKPLCR